MALRSEVRLYNGRPMLHVNGRPTSEFWCYGEPRALPDFVAGGVAICQFHARYPSFWTGPGTYDFAPLDRQFAEFAAAAPDVLLLPRVSFGLQGEGWWSELHPGELAIGRRVDGRDENFLAVRVRPEECWWSAGSRDWTREASAALAAFVEHCETRHGERVLGYQVGGGISAEWFRWWNFIEETYEDYSAPAQVAFRSYLRERYGDDHALRRAWGRADATIDGAVVPPPPRLHEPANGLLRDVRTERDVIDWLDCLSELNASQLIALCEAARAACGERKIVGSFYGYVWPHWNTQSPARSGHMALRRVLDSPALQFISSPYHYDHRMLGGFHHSQTVPEAIARAGKLHLDEIDTHTHLVAPDSWLARLPGSPRTADESALLLRRDAAAVLGSAGTAWWMDLLDQRWFADDRVQRELRELQQLAVASREWGAESYADAALVIDPRSAAYVDLRSNMNQYFTSLPRQIEWSDLGIPLDTLLLDEVARVRPYRAYILLNAWFVPRERREGLRAALSRPGTTAVWFHAAGHFDGARQGAEAMRELIGLRVEAAAGAIPEIELLPAGHRWLDAAGDPPRGTTRFGARLDEARAARLVTTNPRGWDTEIAPLFHVIDERATVLGRYVHNHAAGLATCEIYGARSIFCGAPLLPGWLLRRILLDAGAHAYTAAGFDVRQRGPLVSVYAPRGGSCVVRARREHGLAELRVGADGTWSAVGPFAPDESCAMAPGDTRFFLEAPTTRG